MRSKTYLTSRPGVIVIVCDRETPDLQVMANWLKDKVHIFFGLPSPEIKISAEEGRAAYLELTFTSSLAPATQTAVQNYCQGFVECWHLTVSLLK